jgi:hypothetical protein
MSYQRIQADYEREYRRRKAAHKRALGLSKVSLSSMITDFEGVDPWRRLAYAICYRASLDGEQAKKIRDLCTLCDIEHYQCFENEALRRA